MKLNMATDHDLAVITNSCVKNPVDPDTGLISTIDKREDPSRSSTWQGRIHEYELDKANRANRSHHFDRQVVGPDISNLTDREFYERLISMKEDHKKTLQLCESLYNEKLTELRSSSPLAHSRSNGATTISVSRDFNLSPEPQEEKLRKSFETKDVSRKVRRSTADKIKDMNSSRPPSGRPHTAGGMPRSRSLEKKSAWMTASGSPFGSYEEELYKAGVANNYDSFRSNSRSPVPKEATYTSVSHRNEMNDSKLSAASKFSDMWENFSVDDYAPKTKPRPRSASMSRMTSSRPKSASETTNKEWRHRITIPKPFNMTMRESDKTPMKTKAMLQLDKEKEYRMRKAEAECAKKFKAKPVPAHVYMPLYDEIMEEKETKRRQNKEVCAQLLKSQESPFNFMTREADKKQERKVKKGSLAEYDKQSKGTFKANPFPNHIFKDNVTNKIKEEEEYRQLRVQMRAEKLLRSSSLPPNMASRGQDYVDGKSRQKLYSERAKKAGMTPEHKFRPAVNADMPDFDELHRQYMKEIAQRKARREATVCKPFNLRSERVDRKIHEHDSQSDYRWPHSSTTVPKSSLTKTLSTSMDAMPAKLTTAAQLRMSANKEKMQRQIQSELSELEATRKKRLKEERLKKAINEKAMANDMSSERQRQRQQKLREYRESERARQEDYQGQLNEMFERVDKRPMLFERTAQENARKAADKKYVETLQKAGLNEDFVNKKGKAASSSGSYAEDHYSNGHVSDEDSYMQSRSRQSASRHTASGSKAGYSDDYEKESRGSRTQSEAELEEELA